MDTPAGEARLRPRVSREWIPGCLDFWPCKTGSIDARSRGAYAHPWMPAATPARTSSEALFGRYRTRIHRHIRTLVRNRGDAEDLTQETFLRAHRQLESLENPAALSGWLHRIATNVCIDFLREASRRGTLDRGRGDEEAGRADELARAAEVPAPDEVVDSARMNACGEEFLEKLPRTYRRVIILHDFLGLTSVEIARRLRCTPGAVKIRLHRARSQFRSALEAGCEFHHDERGALIGGRKALKR